MLSGQRGIRLLTVLGQLRLTERQVEVGVVHVIEEKAQIGDTFTWDAVGGGWGGVRGCLESLASSRRVWGML